MRAYLQEFWQHRELTRSFAMRDIKARYKQTALGAAWAIVQPFSLWSSSLVFAHLRPGPDQRRPLSDLFVLRPDFLDLLRHYHSPGNRRHRGDAQSRRRYYFPARDASASPSCPRR